MEDNVLGIWTEPFAVTIEQSHVDRFVEALGDRNPLYGNEEMAKTSVHGRLIAPPTFPITLPFNRLPGGTFDFTGMIHGEQSFAYERPLYIGETIQLQSRLASKNERKAGGMLMTFYVLEQRGLDQDHRVIFTASMTVIRRVEVKSE